MFTYLDNGQALLAALFNESFFIHLLSIKILQPAKNNKKQTAQFPVIIIIIIIKTKVSEFWGSISILATNSSCCRFTKRLNKSKNLRISCRSAGSSHGCIHGERFPNKLSADSK